MGHHSDVRVVTTLAMAVAAAAFVAPAGTAPELPRAVRGQPAPAGLRVEVDLSERRLEVHLDGALHARYDVAIGTTGEVTPPGRYHLSHVIWNPAWVPPESAWADGGEPKQPGASDNPLGRVKLSFDDVLCIHGTADTGSLGEPASHGCIRMRNRDAIELGKLVMEHGGAGRSATWHEEVLANRHESVEVEVPDPPALHIVR